MGASMVGDDGATTEGRPTAGQRARSFENKASEPWSLSLARENAGPHAPEHLSIDAKIRVTHPYREPVLPFLFLRADDGVDKGAGARRADCRGSRSQGASRYGSGSHGPGGGRGGETLACGTEQRGIDGLSLSGCQPFWSTKRRTSFSERGGAWGNTPERADHQSM